MVYDAFISYGHSADGRLAPAVQAGLQRLARPWYRRRALRVFRDETGLSVNPHLWESIAAAMGDSRYFVLLASPDAAISPWVDREIRAWLESHAADTLLPVLTGGTLVWDRELGDFDPKQSSALPPALAGVFPDEPRYLDLRWARDETQLDLRHSRFRSQIATLAAPMHGIAREDLEGEDVRLHRRALRLAWGGIASLALLTVGALVAAGFAVAYAQTARAERQKAVVLGARATRNAQEATEQRAKSETNAARANKNATEAKQQRTLAQQNEAQATANAGEAAANAKTAAKNATRAEQNAVEANRQKTNAETNAARAEANATEAQKQQTIAEANATEAQKQRTIAEANATEAQKQRTIAEANARTALSRQLAARAASDLDGNFDAALLEAVSARSVKPTIEARGSLLRAVGAQPEVQRVLHAAGDPTTVLSAPDRPLLATVSRSRQALDKPPQGTNTVEVWDARGGDRLGGWNAAAFSEIVFGPQGLMVESGGSGVRIRDAITGTVRADLGLPADCGPPFIDCSIKVALSVPQSGNFGDIRAAGLLSAWECGPATCSQRSRVVEWDLGNPAVPRGEFTIDTGSPDAFAMSPDGTYLAWSDFPDDPNAQPNITIRHLDDGATIGPLAVSSQAAVFDLSFAPDSRTLVSTTQHGPDAAVVWDPATGERVRAFSLPDDGDRYISAVSRDQRLVAVGSFSGNSLQFFDAATGEPAGRTISGGAPPRWDSGGDSDFSADGSVFAETYANRAVKLIATGGETSSLGKRMVTVSNSGVVLSADGSRYLTHAPDSGRIEIRELSSGRTLGTLPAGTNAYGLVLNADGSRAAWTDSISSRLTVWDVDGGAVRAGPATCNAGPLEVGRPAALSDDGRTIAVVCPVLGPISGPVLELWDADTFTLLPNQFPRPAGASELWSPGLVVFSPLGGTIATTSSTGGIAIWNGRDPARLVPTGAGLVARNLIFSADGTRLAATLDDGTIGVWATSNGAFVQSFSAPVPGRTELGGIAFSPDGTEIAAARYTVYGGGLPTVGGIQLLDVATGDAIGPPVEGDGGPIGQLVFVADGTLVSSSQPVLTHGGTIVRWDLRPDVIVRRACKIANRDLTGAEWTRLTNDLVPYLPCQGAARRP